MPPELGYPDNDFNKLGPRPLTFSVIFFLGEFEEMHFILKLRNFQWKVNPCKNQEIKPVWLNCLWWSLLTLNRDRGIWTSCWRTKGWLIKPYFLILSSSRSYPKMARPTLPESQEFQTGQPPSSRFRYKKLNYRVRTIWSLSKKSTLSRNSWLLSTFLGDHDPLKFSIYRSLAGFS